MYLRRQYTQSGEHYVICESYQGGGCWKHRTLMDLGTQPENHIRYAGGNSFYVAESVEDRLRQKGAIYTAHELEAIFLPFLDPEIRRIVQTFDRGFCRPRKGKRFSPNEMLSEQKKLHSFDKRRLHYLRCGRVDIGDLDGRPWKFLNVLLEKSRDEIEALLQEMERGLPPNEIRSYLFTSLQVQTHFSHLMTRNQPWALDPERVDHYFTKDLCRLNKDKTFFRGVEDHDPKWLHPYLVRYLILYFDLGLDAFSERRSPTEEMMRRHRFSHFHRSRTMARLSAQEHDACKWLGVSPGEFQEMGFSELVSQFRRRAMETHPDRGGDSEEFVRIQKAYACLRRKKH